MKGIILAGGSGSRLYPLTLVQSKQLLPVYDKPMIYYPLSTLISCGIQEILIITNREYIDAYKTLLGNGNDFGIHITYAIQEKPLGIAQALLIARDYIFDECCTLILGDNIFIGSNVVENLKQAFLSAYSGKASLFLKNVEKPTSFGVATLDVDGNITKIEEKPQITNSNWAVTGLYVYPKGVAKYANDLIPSSRGELEITDLNCVYLNNGKVAGYTLADDVVWFDAGTTDNLLDASIYIRQQEEKTGEMIGCPEVCAIRNHWLDTNKLDVVLEKYKNDKRVDTLRHTFMTNLKNV